MGGGGREGEYSFSWMGENAWETYGRIATFSIRFAKGYQGAKRGTVMVSRPCDLNALETLFKIGTHCPILSFSPPSNFSDLRSWDAFGSGTAPKWPGCSGSKGDLTSAPCGETAATFSVRQWWPANYQSYLWHLKTNWLQHAVCGATLGNWRCSTWYRMWQATSQLGWGTLTRQAQPWGWRKQPLWAKDW